MPRKLEALCVMAIITGIAIPYTGIMKPVIDYVRKVTAPHYAEIDRAANDDFDEPSVLTIEEVVVNKPVIQSIQSPLWNSYQSASPYILLNNSLLVPDSSHSLTIDQYFFIESKPKNYVELVKP